MDFLKNFDFKTTSILKIAGLAVAAIIVIAMAFRLIGASFNAVFQKQGIKNISSSAMPGYDMANFSGEMAAFDSKISPGSSAGLSVRNVTSAPSSMPIYQDNGSTGDQAEAFEVTEYYATIETRQLDKTCAVITDLKPRPDVIFENANEYDRGCNYYFKVKRDKADEILAIIKDLNPKELSDNTYTIKNLIDDFTGQIEILQNKLSSIDDTMKKAVSAYDEITVLATKVQNVESLAKIIDSKINIIERLTQERININSQLESIGRSKAEQLDRLEYTYFRLNIIEDKFIDVKNLKDSWKLAIKTFVHDINQIAQDISINLLGLLFLALQYIIYLLVLLVIAKYSWQLIKYIWRK